MNWISVTDRLPEDCLPLKQYKMWGKERKCTPYVLVIREHRERVDCAKRVLLDGTWYWSDGDGVSAITHWAEYERPPFDTEEHKAYVHSIREAMKRNGSQN